MTPTSPKASSRLDVEYLGGIHLVDSVLWMDAPRRADLSFISHAHLSPSARHGKVLMSEVTARLTADAIPGTSRLISPYHRRFALGDLDLELHPAGHIPGSAQLQLTTDNTRLVYTGHFNLDRTRTAEKARIIQCDFLVLSAHYGKPGSTFPARKQVEEDILAWTEKALSQEQQPVFLCSALGNAQELASLLGKAGHPVRVQRSIYQNCKTYHQLGIKLPQVKCYRGTPHRTEVTIFPLAGPRGPGLARTIDKLPRKRLAVVSGRCTTQEINLKNQTLGQFSLSTLADHSQLVRYARESGASRIAVVGRDARPLADELRGMGLNAWPLRPPSQMSLFAEQQ